jgi:hypothetical protein
MHEFDDATGTFRMLGVPYPQFLAALHTHLSPQTYLEVGTETGASLALISCDTIAVDPKFQLQVSATGSRKRTFFFQMPSDTFFATENVRELLGRPLDLAFLDGMHRFELADPPPRLRAVESANGIAEVVAGQPFGKRNCELLDRRCLEVVANPEEVPPGSAGTCARLPADWPGCDHSRRTNVANFGRLLLRHRRSVRGIRDGRRSTALVLGRTQLHRLSAAL